MIAGFFLPVARPTPDGRPIRRSPTSRRSGQTAWLVGMLVLVLSSMLGSINMIVTILQLRAPGMTLMRLPFFVWAQLVTSFLLLLAFPPLQAAAVLQFMDRLAGTSFFLPTGLVISGEPLAASGGGSPILWQHLFWFLAPSRGLRPDPAGVRHRRRGDREHHAQAAVGLPRAWSAPRCSWRSCRSSCGRTTCS